MGLYTDLARKILIKSIIDEILLLDKIQYIEGTGNQFIEKVEIEYKPGSCQKVSLDKVIEIINRYNPC